MKLDTDADYLRHDIKLKSLREVSRETLKAIAGIKDSKPQMSFDIDQTILNVGLRLPTPSPIHSPASTARLSARSTASSRSALSQRSAASARSEQSTLATNTGM